MHILYNSYGDYMSRIFKIVLSGGPCAGKTTIIDMLNKYYTDKGYNVIVVPESARQVIGQGITKSDLYNFEYEVAKRQLENENIADNNLASYDSDTIIFYDRGLTDAFGYLNYRDRARLQDELEISHLQSWSRYDAVLFLETAAISDIYITDDERSEDIDEAIRCHISLLDIWMGHPHLRYIKSTDNIEDKLKKAITEIDCIVNSIEHEVKYLIEYPDLEFLQNYKHFKADIEQIYLMSNQGSHRIRKRGCNGEFQYFETLKKRLTDDSCIEEEHIITADMYEALKSIADPNKNPIKKQRYCLLHKAQYFELDIFPFWSDKALIELELSTDNQEVILPPEIKVIKDVSKDIKYKNKYLAGLKL